MNLLNIGCNFKKTTVDVREKLAFEGEKLPRALNELSKRFGCEAVILSTCNRVEMYLAQSAPDERLHADSVIEFLSEFHNYPVEEIRPNLYSHQLEDSIRHLFRVAASLDSMIIGEAQITGQVKQAYEFAKEQGTTGPILNVLFQHARTVARRVRTDTGIAQGHVSISSAAVDYVREVFDHFHDKVVLVIGAGKMGVLTLKQLKGLKPGRILVTNRSPEKALEVAGECGGEPVPWDDLDSALLQADIVLSTTGASEPIMSYDRYAKIAARRTRESIVIIDIAVPRDFDSEIHDGETTFLFNIDDLKRVQEATLSQRRKHIEEAEEMVEEGVQVCGQKLGERRNGRVIQRLQQEVEAKREKIVTNVLSKLNGKLSDEEKKYLTKSYALLTSQILHGPIKALTEETPAERSTGPHKHTLLEAILKLFRLED